MLSLSLAAAASAASASADSVMAFSSSRVSASSSWRRRSTFPVLTNRPTAAFDAARSSRSRICRSRSDDGEGGDDSAPVGAPNPARSKSCRVQGAATADDDDDDVDDGADVAAPFETDGEGDPEEGEPDDEDDFVASITRRDRRRRAASALCEPLPQDYKALFLSAIDDLGSRLGPELSRSLSSLGLPPLLDTMPLGGLFDFDSDLLGVLFDGADEWVDVDGAGAADVAGRLLANFEDVAGSAAGALELACALDEVKDEAWTDANNLWKMRVWKVSAFMVAPVHKFGHGRCCAHKTLEGSHETFVLFSITS